MKNLLKEISFRKMLLKQYLRAQFPWPYNTELKRPIFILGSSRSGTSILTDVLSFSPQLCNFSENDTVRRNMWSVVEHPELIHKGLPNLEKILVRLSGIKSGQRLLEKSPGHSLLAEELANYFVDAKFVHIVRDPRDVASSMLKHAWIKDELNEIHSVFWFRLIPLQFQKEWPTLSPWKRAILRWAVYVSSARKLSGQSDRYLEIRYEEFCDSPKTYLDKVLAFLELEKDESINAQLERVKPRSSFRWRTEDLKDDQLEFVNRVISEFGIDSSAIAMGEV
ncbi:sulfotransferase family protein [Altericista sp. CCNU0014]|uniref:sulfotransferase family protein n=1 Tax=Altericista sp. CCNU0014 TaxID=3082949 RepID=UPI003850CB5B